MDRRTSLVVEGLEERALRSSVSYSLTADQSVYQVGQAIELTFTETNTSDQPETVDVSPTDFTVSQNNSALWQSDPTNANVPPTSETLLPGQSVSQMANWNGTWDFPQPTSQDSTATVPINALGTLVVSNPNAPPGLTATFQIGDPVTYSLTTNSSVYQLSDPVTFSFAMVNTSDEPITILVDPPPPFSITHNGMTVDASIDLEWEVPITIAAGQTYANVQTWDGISDVGPYAVSDLTGTFTVACGSFSTPFQIEAPPDAILVTTVASNQATYQAGQPIKLTYTETNQGNQPVSIVAGLTDFQITQNGTTQQYDATPSGTVLSSFDNPSDTTPLQQSWLLLQPGQSYTQTATWDGPPEGSAGTFAVSDLLDPNGSSATFQVLSTSHPAQTNQNADSSASSTSSYPVAATLLAAHPSYKLGESVQLSLVLKDVSGSKVTIKKSRNVETVTVHHGSTVVYESARKASALPSQMIKAGRPLKLMAFWSGKVNQVDVKKLTPGAYTITVDDDGYVASTAVLLSGPFHK